MPLSPRTLRPANNFTPRSISGLALWLDASDASTLFQDAAATTPATATSDPVGAWLDKSGNARHATQSTAGSRPTVSGTLRNNRRVTQFASASNQTLSADSLSSVVTGSDVPMTAIAVCLASSSASTATILGFGNSSTDAPFFVLEKTVNDAIGARRRDDASSLASATASGASLTSWSIASMTFAGQSTTLSLNGADVANNAALDCGTLSLTTANIGALRRTSVVTPFASNIAELLVYSRAVSQSERRRLEVYLANRWGITLAPQVSNADAQDWINRVYANGGTVSASTAAAVNTLCNSLDAASLRDRFYRLNLFCGSNLNAALVPLYRNWSGWSGRNLLSTGDNLTASAWTKSASTASVSASERPFAYGPFACAATASAGSGVTPYVVNTSNNYGYGTVTVSAYLKANGINSARILLSGSSGMTFPGGGSVAYATVNLTNGAVSSVLSGATATATDVGNGWWRFALTVANNSTGNMAVRIDIGSGSSYTATGSESILVWGIQSEVAPTASAYEPYPLGNATDTNNAFVGVGTDYAETGASGGLTGNGTSKYLATGLNPYDAGLSETDFHTSGYFRETQNTSGAFIGCVNSSAQRGVVFHPAYLTFGMYVRFGGLTNSGIENGTLSSRNGHLLGVRRPGGAGFKDGANINATSVTTGSFAWAASADSPSLYVFARNDVTASPSIAHYAGRSQAYSIGKGMTDAQAAAYYTAMQAFQTALGRNV